MMGVNNKVFNFPLSENTLLDLFACPWLLQPSWINGLTKNFVHLSSKWYVSWMRRHFSKNICVKGSLNFHVIP